MIHPEKHTRHKEFRDYWIRDKVCRELEREYGLVVDNGRNKGAERSLGEKAALLEAHTGQQSFEGYAQAQRAAILQMLEAATSWQETHEALACHGLEIKPHGNGLVIKDRHGKQTMKASALDRNLSLKKLEARFGAFTPPRDLEHVREQSRYQAEPLQRSPERGKLFAEYRQGIEERKNRLEVEAKYEEQKQLIGKQQEQIEELGKRTSYVELVLQCKGLLDITQIAQDYGMSGRKMKMFRYRRKMFRRRPGTGQAMIHRK